MITQDLLNSLSRMNFFLSVGDTASLEKEILERYSIAKKYQEQEWEMYKDFIRKTDPKSRLLSEDEWSKDDEVERMKFKYGNNTEETVEPVVR